MAYTRTPEEQAAISAQVAEIKAAKAAGDDTSTQFDTLVNVDRLDSSGNVAQAGTITQTTADAQAAASGSDYDNAVRDSEIAKIRQDSIASGTYMSPQEAIAIYDEQNISPETQEANEAMQQWSAENEMTTAEYQATLPEIEPLPFFSVEGQLARKESAITTPIQAILSQFGLATDIEADSALVKWLVNNPVLVAAAAGTAWNIGTAAVGSVGIGSTATTGSGSTIQMATNTYTAKLFQGALSHAISPKAILFYGAWASSVAFGKWGQSEAVEQFTYLRDKYLIPEAIRTGDWTLVDAAQEAADELMDPSWLTKLGLYSPVSGILGSVMKTLAMPEAQIIRNKFIQDQKDLQNEIKEMNLQYQGVIGGSGSSEGSSDTWSGSGSSGGSGGTDYQGTTGGTSGSTYQYDSTYNDQRKAQLQWEADFKAEQHRVEGLRLAEQRRLEDEYWVKRNQEQQDQERQSLDYFNQQRKMMIQFEIDAENADMRSDAAFWRKENAATSAREKKEREEIASFWLNYKKLSMEVSQENQKSNLSFGLL